MSDGCEQRERFPAALAEGYFRADELGFEKWTADWGEVIEHPEVEALSITVPNDLHRDVALARGLLVDDLAADPQADESLRRMARKWLSR